MYHMKNIISHNDEIVVPKLMYPVKNIIESLNEHELDINICDQVIKFLKVPNTKMTELEQRQDQLLKKLDLLYERIQTISSNCKANNIQDSNLKVAEKPKIDPEEVVLIISPDNLPWYLNVILNKSSLAVNVSWHIHSSIPNEKVTKIKGFVKLLQNMEYKSKINLRLIFKPVSVDSELKLSSLSVPIVGTVNILRYLSFAYPSIIPYDHKDYYVDTLLDLCHLLERTPEKNKEALVKKLFTQHKEWIYGNYFSIVDLAAYNVIKQWRSSAKYVPKAWFDKCEKLCL